MRATSKILIIKAIAAIALTTSTAGGIALATTSTPAAPHARTTSGSTATNDAASSPHVTATPTATEADPLADEASDPAGRAPRTTTSAKAPHATGLCRASSNVTTEGHEGKAAQSPAFTDLDCTTTRAEPTRPTGRPSVAPGNPDQRIGRPDTAGRPQDGTGDEAEQSGEPEKPAGPARGENVNRETSGTEHRDR